MARLYSDCDISIKSSTVATKKLTLLLSAKLWADEIKIQKKKSLKNRLDNIGPNIDSCGTPDKVCLKLLVALFMQTHCFHFSRNIMD